MKSDGALLLRYWERVESDELKLLRLFDESHRGRIASEYSVEEIAALEASPHLTLSIVASYLALRAAQQRRDRGAFVAVLARMRAKVEQWDKATYVQMRDIWSEEIEAALNGSKTAKAALDAAVERGNTMLRQFERTVR